MHAVGAVVSPLCTLQPSLRDAGEGAVGGRVCRTGGGRALGATPGAGTAHLEEQAAPSRFQSQP